MKKVILLVMLAALLLSACSTKTVEEKLTSADGELYWIVVSDIGPLRVLWNDYDLCSVGDSVKVLGCAHGAGYWRVRCWQ